MKNILIVCLALTTIFALTSCEKGALQELEKETQSAQKTQQIVLEKMEQQKEQLLTAASDAAAHLPSSNARSKETTKFDFSMEDAEAGMLIMVGEEVFDDIPGATVTITDNGDFDTYVFTIVDSFEEVENTVTYTIELNIDKEEKTIIERPFSIAWPRFSAWPVAQTYLFGYWSAELVAENDEQVVIDVPLNDPFFLYSSIIDLEEHGFEFQELEGLVRITALKQ